MYLTTDVFVLAVKEDSKLIVACGTYIFFILMESSNDKDYTKHVVAQKIISIK